MQINGYRIGNYLSIKGSLGRVIFISGDIHTGATEIKIREVNTQNEFTTSDDIEPIKITNEFLSRFGFIKEYHTREGEVYSISVSDTEAQKLMLKDNVHSFYCFLYQAGNEFSLYPIVYVHQLQNLYYALTAKDF